MTVDLSGLSDLESPLDVNVEDADLPELLSIIDLLAMGAVEVSMDFLMLEELPSIDIKEEVFL